MTFLQPANLFWGGLVAVVLLLYLRLFAVQEVEAPALFLWREALARRPAWQRWQRFFSAALQVMILACLVLAAAEPAWVGPERPARSVAIIVDRSASMRATDVAPTRFDAALAAAKKHAALLQPGDRAMVLSDGAYTDILSPLTADPAAWSAALEAIKPTDGVGRLSETVALAQARLAGEPNPEILIFTDGSSPDAPVVAKLRNVRVATFATAESGNVAFTRYETRASPAGDEESLMVVRNFGSTPASVELSADSDMPPTDKVTIPAGEAWRRVMPFKQGPNRFSTQSLNQLANDDRFQGTGPAFSRAAILVVGELRPQLLALLRGSPAVTIETAAIFPKQVSAETIVVWQGEEPTKLPSRAIVFEPKGECDAFRAGQPIEQPLPVARQQATPILAGVGLEYTVIEGARQLDLIGAWETLAESENQLPLVAARSSSQQRVVLVNIDLERTDLLLRREAKLLVSQLVDWVADRSTADARQYTTDSFLSFQRDDPAWLIAWPAPTDLSDARYKEPTSPYVEWPATVARFGPLEQVGVWGLRPGSARSPSGLQGGDIAALVCLLNADESNITPRVTGTIPETAATASTTPAWPLWWLPAGLAGLLLLLEWALYQRRVTI